MLVLDFQLSLSDRNLALRKLRLTVQLVVEFVYLPREASLSFELEVG